MTYLIAAYGLTALSLIGYGIHLSRERHALGRAWRAGGERESNNG